MPNKDQIVTKIDDAVVEGDAAGKDFGLDIFRAVAQLLEDLFGKIVRKLFGFELL